MNNQSTSLTLQNGETQGDMYLDVYFAFLGICLLSQSKWKQIIMIVFSKLLSG